MRGNIAVLQQWAQFGGTYATRRLFQRRWLPVERLIDAAKPHLREEATTLRLFLKKWSDRFGMLDPLLNDLGAHRWLDKETSYSDWLAWVLQRLGPNAIFDVLNVKVPFNFNDAGKCQVERESRLDERFIDLLICFDEFPDYAIGVEIKKGDEQYTKQNDYRESLRERFHNPSFVLIPISTDIDENQLYGFTLRPWRAVTFALREKIAEYARKNGSESTIITAMMLAFVAAVEQNLLEFSVSGPRRAWKHEPTLISKDLVRYLGGDK
jgi:hypothetical protein